MKTLLQVGREVLADLVKLNLPVTAAASATFIVGALGPFGVDLSTQTKAITAALGALGLVVSYVSKLIARTKVAPTKLRG